MKNADLIFSWSLTGIAALATSLYEVLDIISIIIGLICAITSIAFTCVRWYTLAKQDGKITKEEIEQLLKDVKEAAGPLEDIKSKFDNLEKK